MWCERVDAAAVILPFVLQYFEFTPCVAWTAEEVQHPVVCGMRCEMCSQIQHQGCKCHSWVCQFSGAVMSLQSPLKERTHLQANRLNTACSAELESLSPWQNVDSQLYTRRDYFAQVHKDFRVLAFVNWVRTEAWNWMKMQSNFTVFVLLNSVAWWKWRTHMSVIHPLFETFKAQEEWWTMNQTTVRHMRGSHYFKTYTTLY